MRKYVSTLFRRRRVSRPLLRIPTASCPRAVRRNVNVLRRCISSVLMLSLVDPDWYTSYSRSIIDGGYDSKKPFVGLVSNSSVDSSLVRA